MKILDRFRWSASVLCLMFLTAVATGWQAENPVDAPSTPIWTAVAQGDLEVVRQHIAAGTDLNETLNSPGVPGSGGAPLHIAAISNRTEVTRALVEAGADVNRKADDAYEGTPVHWAAFMGHPDLLSILIDAGADVDAPDRFGNTPLDAATNGFAPASRKRETVEFLKTHGAQSGAAVRAATKADSVADATLEVPRSEPREVERADWAMYNYDARGWRYNASEMTLSPESVGHLQEIWRFPPEGSNEVIGAVHATPSVVDGEVYFGTATSPAFYKLTADGEVAWVYELSSTAMQNWRRSANPARFIPADGVYSSALVTEDSVYFGDAHGVMYCLDRGTGARVWRVDSKAAEFPGAHDANMIMASPILADGKIIFSGGASEHSQPINPFYECCNGRGFVVALDPLTGAIAWKYDVGPEPERFDPPIEIEDEWGVHIFHYGPSTSSVWSTPSWNRDSNLIYFGTDIHNSPRRSTDDDPRNYTEHSAAVIAVDGSTGEERWVSQVAAGDVWNHSMPPYDEQTGLYKDLAVGDTPKVYTIEQSGAPRTVVGAGCKNGGFYVFDASTGEQLAHTPLYSAPPSDEPEVDPRTLALPGPIGGLQTGCATDGERVYTNGIDRLPRLSPWEPNPPTGGRVTAIALDSSAEFWRHERPLVSWIGGSAAEPIYTNVGDPIASGIAVANGVLFCTSVASNQLLAIDTANGELLKSIPLGPVFSGPSVSRGRVYVGTGNTLFLADDSEAYFPKKYTGEIRVFGLPVEQGRDLDDVTTR